MLLAGDVGGTKTRLALFEAKGQHLRLVTEERYSSRDYASPVPLLQAFFAVHPATVDRITLGIAGPVRQGRVETPNLPWSISARELEQELRSGPVTLLNDLEANAYGLLALTPSDFVVLHPGIADAGGSVALISAGTGLGEAGLFWDGSRYRPFASEGGHADFAARDALQAELAASLAERFGHVSYERILSGPGLHNTYEFLRHQAGAVDELPALMAQYGEHDPSATISRAAVEGRSEVCSRALDLFASVYGAEAGNLALKLLATGGVYLGGGIAPKILPVLQRPGFLKAFLDKGRMRSLLEAIPVRVILNEGTALLGAAHHAAELYKQGPTRKTIA